MRSAHQHHMRVSGSRRHHQRHSKQHKTQSISTATWWKLVGLFLFTGLLTNISNIHLDQYLPFASSWWFDMLQHLGYYFLLTICLFIILPSQKRSLYFLLIIFGVSVLFEITQVFIYQVRLSVPDLVSNFSGISLAFLLSRVLNYIKYRYAKGY